MSETTSELPSYEAATAEADTSYQKIGSTSQNKTLQATVTNTRTEHIKTTIVIHILPIIQQRASVGLSRTSIALLPHNLTYLTTDQEKRSDFEAGSISPLPKIIDIISSHCEDEDIQQIQLLDPMDSRTFWSQRAVIGEFSQILTTSLNSGSETSERSPRLETAQGSPRTLEQQPPPQPRSKPRNFFSRKISSKGQREDKPVLPVFATPVAEGSSVTSTTVEVQSDEVCLRTQNEFGLYETMMRPALIVRVSIHD